MKIKEEVEGAALTVFMDGKFDETCSLEAGRKLGECLSRDVKNIRIDLGKVSYISSAGICELISVYKKAVKMDKRVTISEMSGKVREILDVVGILPLFKSQSA